MIPFSHSATGRSRREKDNQNGGSAAMPERYRVRYAHSAKEVLRELQNFVDHVKTGPVITLLPRTLHDLSVQEAGDVAKWQERVARELRHTCPLGATAECWLNILDEMFRGALQRLDELAHAGDEGVSAPVPGKSNVTPSEAQS
jgi:hypothetical protein